MSKIYERLLSAITPQGKKTGTRSIPEVKQCRARIVPGWLNAWKFLVL